MRALKSLIGMATMALTASLVGCGGGGDAGEQLTPLGTLKVSNASDTALNGTFTAQPVDQTTVEASTVGDGFEGFKVSIDSADPSSTTDFVVFIGYTSTGEIAYIQYDAPFDVGGSFLCDNTDGDSGNNCPGSGVTLDATGRTIRFTRYVLNGGPGDTGKTVTLNGALGWKALPA